MDRRLILLSAALLLVVVSGCSAGPVSVTLTDPTATAAQAPAATDTPAPATATPLPQPTAVPTKGAGKPLARSTPEVSEITIAADGSGDYARLEEAVAAAPDGATIRLGPGRYVLDDTLTVTRPIRLIGVAMDDTFIVRAGAGEVAVFDGAGPFVVEDLTFRREGAETGNVVEVRRGEIAFSYCGFTGGVWDAAGETGGDGLFIYGDTTGTVSGCWSRQNGLYGIQVSGTAQVLLEANVTDLNEHGGISYWGDAGGTARANRCADNGFHGIAINDRAAPVLLENVCQANADSGISYWGSSGGEARGNDCSANGYHGIAVAEEAAPLLEDNLCHGNGDSGIAYFGKAAGEARGNECFGNSLHGIAVLGEASPLLEANFVHDNLDSGIAYFGASAGEARDNRCSGNGLNGLYVEQGSAVRLSGNQCDGEPAQATAPSGPRFNPSGDPWCLNAPEPALDRVWQVSAPREPIMVGETAEVGLRNKLGESNEAHDLLVRVIAPGEVELTASTTLRGDEWAMLVYPDDFGGGPTGNGVYTVIWEVVGAGYVACDGFSVIGGASSDG